MLGLDSEARGWDQPGSELSIPAVMGAQGPQGFNLDCLSLAPSKGGRDDVILESSLEEWEDLCHSLCSHRVRSLWDTGSFLLELWSEGGLSPLEFMLFPWLRETQAFLL